MQSNLDHTLVAARERWWADWYSQDYSWDGLKEKRWECVTSNGHRINLTLQDYWQDEVEHLVPGEDGKKYTKFHLPFEYFDAEGRLQKGAKSGWSDDAWAAFYADLEKRVNKGFILFPKAAVLTFDNELPFQLIPDNPADVALQVVKLARFDGISIQSLQTYPFNMENVFYKKIFAKTFVEPKDSPAPVYFSSCYFEEFSYIGRQLSSHVSLSSCVVQGELAIKSCGHRTQAGLSITDCIIDRISFENSKFNSVNVRATLISPHLCDFSDAVIDASADFRGSGFAFMSAFYRTKIEGTFSIDHEIDGEAADPYFRKNVLRPLLTSGSEATSGRERRVARSRVMRHLEGGASTIRHLLKRDNFEELAHRFYRYELQAREQNPSSNLSMRMISTAYRLSSGYGYDIWRPFLSAILLCLCSAAIYLWVFSLNKGWQFGVSLTTLQSYADALSFSVGRIAPIVPWDAKVNFEAGSLDFDLRHQLGATGLLVHSVAVFQTLTSTMLLFLSALAARRKFKMSD